jgi:hypothetical protein
MKKILGLILTALFVLPTTDARAYHRAHVVIHKRPPHVSVQPVPPLAVVPPLAMVFDLARRTSCDPAVAVATGPNDPGFTSHPVGNYLIPAINRSECRAAPK